MKNDIRINSNSFKDLRPGVKMMRLIRTSGKTLLKSKIQLKLELEDTKLLQSISTELLNENDIQVLYDKIIEAAARIMHSDFASLQIYCPDRGSGGQLRFIAHLGFDPQAVKFWKWVDASSGTSCGAACREIKRVIVPNVSKCDYIKGTKDFGMYMKAGIQAVQTTPLVSRAGKLLGMFSTHWCNPHHPAERELLVLDVLARQASDLIEHKMADENLRESQKNTLELVEKLRQADQNKNFFINILSHELRNPLASITMSLELIEKAFSGGGQATMALEIAKRQAKQLACLVDDLLDASRISQNKIVLKKERVELNELIKKTIRDFRLQFAEKKVKLETGLVQPLYLEGDPTRLNQVVGNLLHNAAKFTTEGDLVTVTLSRDVSSNEAVITVKDTGQGIDPGHLVNLFKPFSLVDKSLDRKNGGLGLGLSIVKGMVESHGGSVEAFSEGKDKGARFTIRLPLLMEITGSQNGKENIKPLQGRPYMVLVIDDNIDLTDIMCALISSIGHTVVAVHNGIEGIAKAKDFKPDIIICDIGLPGMDGYEVAQELRKKEEHKATFLIALSGYAQPEDIERSKEAGFDLHLSKPVTLETLQQVLNID